MSLLRAAAVVGGVALLHRWATDPERRSPDDYKPGTFGTASANWPHIAYGQLDVLGRHQGFWAGRDPRLPGLAGGGGRAAPLMNTGDAVGIYRYWLSRVEKYAGDQTYQTNTLEEIGEAGAFGPLGDWLFTDGAETEVKTNNPYRRLTRRMAALAAKMGERRGMDRVDDLEELAARVGGGYAWMYLDEVDEFWAGVLSAAGDLKVTEEFNPSEWSIAMDALGEAAAEAPHTLAEWLGTGTVAVVKAAGQVAGGLALGLVEGLAPLLAVAVAGWLLLR